MINEDKNAGLKYYFFYQNDPTGFNKMNNNEFNTFDTERELEKKCNRLVGGKKRSLKMDYSIEPVFDVTWEVD